MIGTNNTVPQRSLKQTGGTLQKEVVCRFIDKLGREVEEFRHSSDSREGAGSEDERNGGKAGGGNRGEGFLIS